MFSKITTSFKELFGSENEFVASVDLALKERITSPFYGYFFISWLIINWKLLYVSFFISQELIFEKTGLLRDEYLSSIFPSLYSFSHWWSFLILPLCLTILFLWVFPYVTRIFYRKSIKNQVVMKIIELQETTRTKNAEKQLVKEEVQLIKVEGEKAKQKKKIEIESPEIIWEQEFEDFRKSSHFHKLKQVTEVIYTNSGLTQVWDGNYRRIIDTDILAIVHTKGLVLIKGSDTSEKIELTEKGKFFISRFLESNS